MHRRKEYIVYPPGYTPEGGRRYRVVRSRLQAIKAARRMGVGAEIDVRTQIYMAARTMWRESRGAHLGAIVSRLSK